MRHTTHSPRQYAHASRRDRRVMSARRKELCALVAAFSCALLCGAALTVIAAVSLDALHTCRVIVDTSAGDRFIIGEGDTCRDAWQDHGPIPDNWTSIYTR